MKPGVSDIEDLAPHFEAWQAELVPLEPPQAGTLVSIHSLASHRIVHLQAGGAFAARGIAHQSGVLASALPRTAVRHLGRPLQPGDLLALGQGVRFELFVPRGASLVLLLPDAQEWIGRQSLRLCEVSASPSAASLFQYVTAPESAAGLTGATLNRMLRQVVKGSRDARRDRHMNLRVAAVLSTCRFLERSFPAVVSLAELARHSGVAQRTLEYGFRQVYGTTPLAFIRSLRLYRSRHALLRAEAVASISQTARSCGFRHMGQYSRDYRRLFGETPSMTLARGNGRGVGPLHP